MLIKKKKNANAGGRIRSNARRDGDRQPRGSRFIAEISNLPPDRGALGGTIVNYSARTACRWCSLVSERQRRDWRPTTTPADAQIDFDIDTTYLKTPQYKYFRVVRSTTHVSETAGHKECARFLRVASFFDTRWTSAGKRTWTGCAGSACAWAARNSICSRAGRAETVGCGPNWKSACPYRRVQFCFVHAVRRSARGNTVNRNVHQPNRSMYNFTKKTWKKKNRVLLLAPRTTRRFRPSIPRPGGPHPRGYLNLEYTDTNRPDPFVFSFSSSVSANLFCVR